VVTFTWENQQYRPKELVSSGKWGDLCVAPKEKRGGTKREDPVKEGKKDLGEYPSRTAPVPGKQKKRSTKGKEVRTESDHRNLSRFLEKEGEKVPSDFGEKKEGPKDMNEIPGAAWGQKGGTERPLGHLGRKSEEKKHC